MKGHITILRDFLHAIKDESIASILDAGSGRTSLSLITEVFPDTPVDAVVYPGDVRKLNSISETAGAHKAVCAVEKDICSDTINKAYDVVVAHLLLGEATKFGHAFEELLSRLFAIQCKYLIIIDYLEDPTVREIDIGKMCDENHLSVIYKSYFQNEQPQVWETFTGVHNFGYLIKKL